jgi:hypothetical protein
VTILQEAGNADDKAKEEEEEAQESVTAFNGEMRQKVMKALSGHASRYPLASRDCKCPHCLQTRPAWLCRHSRWFSPRSGGTSLFWPQSHWQRHHRQSVSMTSVLECDAVHCVLKKGASCAVAVVPLDGHVGMPQVWWAALWLAMVLQLSSPSLAAMFCRNTFQRELCSTCELHLSIC